MRGEDSGFEDEPVIEEFVNKPKEGKMGLELDGFECEMVF